MTFDKFVLNNYLRGFGVKVPESVLVRRGQENAISKKDYPDGKGAFTPILEAINKASL